MDSPVKSSELSSEIPIGIKDVEEWSIIAIIRYANSIEYEGPMLPVIDKFLKEVKQKYEMNKYRMHSGTYHKACLALEAFEVCLFGSYCFMSTRSLVFLIKDIVLTRNRRTWNCSSMPSKWAETSVKICTISWNRPKFPI